MVTKIPRFGDLTSPLRPRAPLHSSVKATGSGNKTIITPTSGYKIAVTHFLIDNAYAGAQEVFLRFTATGDALYKVKLTENQKVVVSLVGSELMGGKDEALIGNVQTDGDVYLSVSYIEIPCP